MACQTCHRIDKIKNALPDKALENLVAVFSQLNGPRQLLVYNSLSFPLPASKTRQIVPLYKLLDYDLSEFNGPVIAFSAVDVIRSVMPTKGPNFYALEYVFLERKAHAALYHTMRGLARYLTDYLDSLPAEQEQSLHHRGVSKILQLALPAILSQSPVKDLVAALPPSNLQKILDKQNWQLFYNAPSQPYDLENLNASAEDWIVALEEISLFHPDIQPHAEHFLELRDVFQQADMSNSLPETCKNLALRCFQQAKSETRFKKAAFLLMAEVWLATEDAEDLIVLFPHQDFYHFAESGDALRVYRQLAEGSQNIAGRPGPKCTLQRLKQRNILPEYRQIAISLTPRLSLIEDCQQKITWLELGPILWKAGQHRALSRSLWLLAQDWLQQSPAKHKALGISSKALTGLATRAIVLCGLDNPWQWRQGRHRLYLQHCYRTLQGALDRLANSAGEHFTDYYRALSLWYGCYNATSDSIRKNMKRMMHHLKDFLRLTQDDKRTTLLDNCRSNAIRLIETEEAALHLALGVRAVHSLEAKVDTQRILPPAGVREALQRASAVPTNRKILSSFFDYAWRIFLSLRDERRQIHNRESSVDVRLRQLRQLHADFERHKALIFALPHEVAILGFVYNQEIQSLASQIQDLESSAILKITLKNLWLNLQAEHDLHFEVSNIGRVSANEIELVLPKNNSFELLEGSPVREIAILAPRASEIVSYPIRPVQPEVTLLLNVSYRDQHNQQKERKLEFRPEVRGLQPMRFKPKVNRYEFGRPIQSPKDFFGRHPYLIDILSLLKAGGRQNVLLRGPRRMGKTSLLFMLKHALEEPNTRRIFGVPPDWDDDLNLVNPVFVTLQSVDLQSSVAPVYQFFRALLEQICQALSIEAGVKQTVITQYKTRVKEVGAANATLEQLDILLNRSQKHRVAVLLDEYDEIYRPEAHDLDTALRTVISVEQRMTWIIASTMGLFREAKSIGSPWFNIFRITELGILSQNAAQDLVYAPSRGERVYWHSDAVLSLLEETGLHPAFIQLFCSKLITYLNQEESNFILNSSISIVANQIIGEKGTASSHFEFYWSDATGVCKLILLIVDESSAPLKRIEIKRQVFDRLEKHFGQQPRQRLKNPMGNPIEWRQRQFKEGMEWADTISDAISPDEQRRYRFTVPLFHRWLQRRRQYDNLLQETLDTITAELDSLKEQKKDSSGFAPKQRL